MLDSDKTMTKKVKMVWKEREKRGQIDSTNTDKTKKKTKHTHQCKEVTS